MAIIKNGDLVRIDRFGDDDVLLWADFKKDCVCTNCFDEFYNYSISFDDLIKFAEFIKKERIHGKRTKSDTK